MTYKHGKQVSIDATVNTASGYVWSGWKWNSGNTPASLANKSTTVTITENTQLTANAKDTTRPSCNFELMSDMCIAV